MDLLAELFQETSLHDLQPGSKHWVNITHIVDPHSFYVRLSAYKRFMPVLEAKGEPTASANLQPHKIVIYQSKTLNKFVRGSLNVTSTDPDSCNYVLFACDYGFHEECDKKDIFETATKNVPPLAIHCRLADCKPLNGTWTEKSILALKNYIGDEIAKMLITVSSSDGLTVKLFNSNSCPDDISKLLALTGYTTIGYVDNEINRLTTPKYENRYFIYKDLQVNDTLKVQVLTRGDSHGFYVADKTDLKRYIDDRINVTFFSKNKSSLNIEDLDNDKPVAVYLMDDNRYERGFIKKVLSEEKAKIQLVDCGITIESHVSLMKPLSENLFYNPVTAIFCKLEEDQNLDHRINKLIFPGYEFSIEIKEVGEGFNKPNIVTVKQ